MSLVEFNEWYGDKGEKLHIYRDEKWIAKYGFEAGQQSQQTKIDNLQKENDRLNTSYKNVKLQFENKQIDCDRSDRKIDELQARIDSLTNINESLVAYKNQLLDEIEEKGNKDEN